MQLKPYRVADLVRGNARDLFERLQRRRARLAPVLGGDRLGLEQALAGRRGEAHLPGGVHLAVRLGGLHGFEHALRAGRREAGAEKEEATRTTRTMSE